MIHAEEIVFISPQYYERFIIGVDNVTDITLSTDAGSVRIIRKVDGEEKFTIISGIPFVATY